MVEKIKSQGSAGDHLANERTFLAWIRTSIGIMAFGFVVVKFSLFLKQISIILGKGIVDQSKGYSSVAGIVLVIVGAIAAVLSYIRYKKTAKQLDAGYYKHSSLLMTILTAFIFSVSGFLIIYLIKSI
jgi:putative membrane protein